MTYYANINGVDVEITEEQNAEYEALAALVPPPAKPTDIQIKELQQQQLDIAEAVVSLYETVAIGADV